MSLRNTNHPSNFEKSILNFSFLNKNKKKNTTRTLLFLITFFILILFFFILYLNDFWVFIISSSVIFIILIGNGQYYPSFLFLILIIFISFFQFGLLPNLKNKNKKKQCVENFYTLFSPLLTKPENPFSIFQKSKKINTSVFNEKLINEELINKTLVLSCQIHTQGLAMFLSRLFINHTNILNLKVNSYSTFKINKKSDLILLPAPTLFHDKFKGHFLGNVEHQYLFCVASIKSGIQNIHQLTNKKIGLPRRLVKIWNDIIPSFFTDDKPEIIITDNDMGLYELLKESKVPCIFYGDVYPSRFINKIILSEITHSYQLVPVILSDEKIFLKTNRHYTKYRLKLTNEYIPSGYLPTALGRHWQSDYTPDYITFGYDITLVCNEISDELGYQIANALFLNRKLIARNGENTIHENNKNETNTEVRILNNNNGSVLNVKALDGYPVNINPNVWISDPFPPFNITNPSLPNLPVQNGAKQFYIEKGLISYCKDPICMKTIGIKRCEVCDNNPTIPLTSMQWKNNIIKRKIMKLF